MFRRNLKLGLLCYVYVILLLVNLRESDAVCIGKDQTACGSASGCAWKSYSNAFKKHGENTFSANTACVKESCQDTSTVNEQSCNSNAACS